MFRQLRIAGLLCVAVPAVSLAEPAPEAAGEASGGASGRSLEERVSGAKEMIRRSKVRLTDLEERSGAGDAAGAKAAPPDAQRDGAARQPAATEEPRR